MKLGKAMHISFFAFAEKHGFYERSNDRGSAVVRVNLVEKVPRLSLVPKPHCPSGASCVKWTEEPCHWHNAHCCHHSYCFEWICNSCLSYIISLNSYNALMEILLSLGLQESWVPEWLYNLLNATQQWAKEPSLDWGPQRAGQAFLPGKMD